MKYVQRQLEQYAMQAEKMTAKSTDPEVWVNIDEVGKAIGIDSPESRQLAVWLKEKEWAQVHFGDVPRLHLTWRGHQEIADLYLPWWRRFVKNNTSTLWALAGVIVAGMFTLLSQLLVWWLSHKGS